MARKVTEEDIQNMVSLYNSLGTYSAVAKETGFSATTVSKYVKQYNLTKESDKRAEEIASTISVSIPSIEQAMAQLGCVHELSVLEPIERKRMNEIWRIAI